MRARQASFDDALGLVWALDGCSIEIGYPLAEEIDPAGWSAH